MAAADTARLVAELSLKVTGFDQGIKRVNTGLDRVEGKIGKLGVKTTAFGTALGVGLERLTEKGIGALFSQIQQGQDSLHQLQDIQAQTAAVIASTGGAAGLSAKQVRDLADAQEELTTVDDKVIQKGENLLLTFTNIGKDIFPDATKAMVNMGVALANGDAAAVDLDSAAIQLGKALNDPIKGVTALQRVGVSFTQKQKEQIKTLVESGRTLDAQKIILGELEREFGKAGEAAGKSGAAGMRRLDDAVEDLQVSLAEGLDPALTEIRDELGTALKDPAVKQGVKDLGKFLGEALKQGLAFAKSIPFDKVASALKIAAGFAGDLVKAFTSLPPEAQATIIALAGLNKISGGAVTSLISDLGKGLIKGVLGMNAGVVNINAATVNAGGVPGAAGAAAVGKGRLGQAAGLISKVFIVGLAAEVANTLAPITTGAGIAIHDALGLPKITPADLPWPFGPKNTPTILPEIFGGNGALGGTPAVEKLNSKFNDLNGKIGGLSQDERDTARAVDRATNAVHNASVQDKSIAATNQAAAFAIRDKVATGTTLVTGAVNAAKTVAAQTTAAARAAGQQTAAAIRDKDLSVKVQNFNQIKVGVSIRETIDSTTTFKQFNRFIS